MLNYIEVEKAALHDFLTDLPNRRYLHKVLHDMLANSVNKAAILFIDLDNFKQINDIFGHLSGDKVIKMIASRLRVCIRENDFICRYGGDEFIIVLKNIQSAKEVNQIIHQIKCTLKKPLKMGEKSLEITASIGMSIHPDQGKDEKTLIYIADQEMYHKKRLKK